MKLFLALLVALAFSPIESTAQDGQHGHNHGALHETFYQHLIRPDTKGPCCSSADCRPTAGRMVGDHYEVKVDGAWISVPQDKIVRRAAPDLGYHVCAAATFGGQPHQLLCVILPPES